jgi:hypothetical protein
VDSAARTSSGGPDGEVDQRAGLTKSGRLIIIVVVAILVLGTPLAIHAIGSHEADAAVRTAAASGAQAAARIDNETLFRQWADWTVRQQPGQVPGTPRIAHAFLFSEHIDATSATLTYRVSTWGMTRCFQVFKSVGDAGATVLPTCPT